MKRYIKVFYKFFGYDICDFVPCEWCGKRAVNIHHIKKRGMGGSKKLDVIENLASVCMEHHTKADNEPEFNEKLKEKHLINVANGYIKI